jgi:hypothetical protein
LWFACGVPEQKHFFDNRAFQTLSSFRVHQLALDVDTNRSLTPIVHCGVGLKVYWLCAVKFTSSEQDRRNTSW